MTPADVRLTAQLVVDKRVHCVSDEAVMAMARRVLELECPTHYGVGQEELQKVKTERDMAQRAQEHWEAVAAANALDGFKEVDHERDACAKLCDAQEAVWREFERTDKLVSDSWQHRQQANTARDLAIAIRARGAR